MNPQLLAVSSHLLLGVGACWAGLRENSLAFGAFGLVNLLQVPLSLNALARVREGFGNRGLDRERRVYRSLGYLLRLLALGLSLAAGAALFGNPSPEHSWIGWVIAGLSLGLQLFLWRIKGRASEAHPTLSMEAEAAREHLGLSVLLLASQLLAPQFPWADPAAVLPMGLLIFLQGRRLAQVITLPKACGGCGSCGC